MTDAKLMTALEGVLNYLQDIDAPRMYRVAVQDVLDTRPAPSPTDAATPKKETPWDAGKQALALAALEWERLRRGMPGSTPETIARAEAAFWNAAEKLQAVKVSMIRKSIEDARAASPDGKTSWDRVEDYRIEHGHLPRQDGKKEPGCKACQKEKL